MLGFGGVSRGFYRIMAGSNLDFKKVWVARIPGGLTRDQVHDGLRGMQGCEAMTSFFYGDRGPFHHGTALLGFATSDEAMAAIGFLAGSWVPHFAGWQDQPLLANFALVLLLLFQM